MTAGRRAQHQHNPWLMLGVVLTATFMLLVDVSIVNVAIPAIQRGLKASDASVQLIVAGYALTFAVVLITGARLGDIYGRRRMFLIGMTGFTAASVACGAAPSPAFLVVGRIVQGFFGGLMMPQTLSVIQVAFPPRERGRAFGIFGATIGLATIMGPVLGGALIQWNIAGSSWRAIFFVNLPIGIAAIIGTILLLQESTAPDAPRLDLPGTALATTALFLIVFPLVEGREQGWPGWLLGLLCASAVALGAFAVYEERRTRADRYPLVHMTLFRERAFSAGMVLMVVFMCGLPAFFFTFAIYLQVGFGFTALQSGLTVFPFAFGNVVGSILSNRLTTKLGRSVLSLGTLFMSLGMVGVLLTVHALHGDVNAYDFTPSVMVAGFGLGLFIAPVTNIVLAGIHLRAAGSASGVLSATQQVGASLGIALVGVVFFGALSSHVGSATQAASKELNTKLAALGVPPSAVHQIDQGFAACFKARVASDDPARTPSACKVPAGVDPRVTQVITRVAAPTALRHDFRISEIHTLFYEIAVYVLAFLTVFLLPMVRPSEAHPGGG